MAIYNNTSFHFENNFNYVGQFSGTLSTYGGLGFSADYRRVQTYAVGLFNGVNQYANKALALGSGKDLLFSIWFRSLSSATRQYLWSNATAENSGDGHDIYLNSNGSLTYTTSRPGYHQDWKLESLSSGLNDGAWHHVIFGTDDAGDLKHFLVIDGVMNALGSTAVKCAGIPGWSFGRHYAVASGFFEGHLDGAIFMQLNNGTVTGLDGVSVGNPTIGDAADLYNLGCGAYLDTASPATIYKTSTPCDDGYPSSSPGGILLPGFVGHI